MCTQQLQDLPVVCPREGTAHSEATHPGYWQALAPRGCSLLSTPLACYPCAGSLAQNSPGARAALPWHCLCLRAQSQCWGPAWQQHSPVPMSSSSASNSPGVYLSLSDLHHLFRGCYRCVVTAGRRGIPSVCSNSTSVSVCAGGIVSWS